MYYSSSGVFCSNTYPVDVLHYKILYNPLLQILMRIHQLFRTSDTFLIVSFLVFYKFLFKHFAGILESPI